MQSRFTRACALALRAGSAVRSLRSQSRNDEIKKQRSVHRASHNDNAGTYVMISTHKSSNA